MAALEQNTASARMLGVLLGGMLAVGAPGCTGDQYPDCTPENHCHLDANGEPTCDAGYVWEDAFDSDSWVCVAMCGNAFCDVGESPESCPQDCDSCGNAICTSMESPATCPDDCDVCGDGICGATEAPTTCGADCQGCGDTVCQPNETAASCSTDCDVCGNGYCGPHENATVCIADCDSCGNGICGPAETDASCVADCCEADCGGLQCGPDPVCAKSCGTCDDANVCTSDACNGSGLCDHAVVEDTGLSCVGHLNLRACVSGEDVEVSCGAVCLVAGNNGTSGCVPSAATCECYNYSTSTECVAAVRECTSGGGLARCRDGAAYGASTNFWEIDDCQSICQGAGYDHTTSCGVGSDGQDVCFCSGRYCDPPCGTKQTCVEGATGNYCCTRDCDGRACGSDGCGGSCGGCGSNRECVSTAGGGTVCQCRSECQEGSVCCGGAFCAGSCLYHYDCGC